MKIMKKYIFLRIRGKMKVAMKFLRSNYAYIQHIRLEFEKKIFFDFFIFGEGEREGGRGLAREKRGPAGRPGTSNHKNFKICVGIRTLVREREREIMNE